MDLQLTSEQAAVRELAADFVDREVVPHAAEWDRVESVDTSIVGRLAEWAAVVDPRFAPSAALRERVRRQGGFYGRSSAPSREIQPSLGEGF